MCILDNDLPDDPMYFWPPPIINETYTVILLNNKNNYVLSSPHYLCSVLHVTLNTIILAHPLQLVPYHGPRMLEKP